VRVITETHIPSTNAIATSETEPQCGREERRFVAVLCSKLKIAEKPVVRCRLLNG